MLLKECNFEVHSVSELVSIFRVHSPLVEAIKNIIYFGQLFYW